MSRLFIYCYGGFGREVFKLAKNINNEKEYWKDIFFIDDNKVQEDIGNTKIFNWNKYKNEIKDKDDEICIANGEPCIKKNIYKKVKEEGVRIATLIHPSVDISGVNKIGEGSIITDGCVLTINVTLEKCSIININSTIGHDVTIGDFSTISPGCNISGDVKVGAMCYIGSGSNIRDKVNIGEESIVGMGSVVTEDISAKVIAFGNPAKEIRENIDRKVFK